MGADEADVAVEGAEEDGAGGGCGSTIVAGASDDGGGRSDEDDGGTEGVGGVGVSLLATSIASSASSARDAMGARRRGATRTTGEDGVEEVEGRRNGIAEVEQGLGVKRSWLPWSAVSPYEAP